VRISVSGIIVPSGGAQAHASTPRLDYTITAETTQSRGPPFPSETPGFLGGGGQQ
jgi:hypothetical protein